MKDSGLSYLLAALGFVTPVAGLHRFYLGRPLTGVLYLCTWGLMGIGTLVDMFHIDSMVRDENRKLLPPGEVHLHVHGEGQGSHRISVSEPPAPRALPEPKKSAERLVLELASQNDGAVTIEMVALKTELSLANAQRELERLKEAGFCTVDVNTEGAYLYLFPGLRSNRPFEIE